MADPVIKQAGAQSVTFYVSSAVEPARLDSENAWSLLPSGQLKSVLNRVYTKIVDDEVVADVDAFFEEMMRVAMVTTLGGVQIQSTSFPGFTWDLSNGGDGQPPVGTPKMAWGAPTNMSIHISSRYSASE